MEGWICLDQLANEMHNAMGLLLHLRKSSIGRKGARTDPPNPVGSAAGQESVDARRSDSNGLMHGTVHENKADACERFPRLKSILHVYSEEY